MVRSKMTWAAAASVMALCLLPFKAGGCAGKTACISVSPADFAKTGQCPSAAQMTDFFFDDCFGGHVESVDGEGTYDGQLCCYPVTNFDENGGIAECFGGFGGGVGGAGGFGGGCATCADFVATPGLSPNVLCNGFDQTFLDLQDCGCQVCPTCALNFCKNVGATTECLNCVESECVSAFSACQSAF